MCITEFNQDVYEKGLLQEGIEEGIEKGLEKGLKEGRQAATQAAICNMIRYGVKKEVILQDYSEEEYEQAERSMLTTV
jgi:flagellar biosynthesis/type III secretory pathway protein FliH